MFPKENRLAKVRDFNLVLKYGHWANGRFLNLKYLELAKNKAYFPSKEDPDKFVKQLKLAITVGTKISKSAVKRNRAKRQTREAIRLLIKANRAKAGYYGLIVAKPEVLIKNYAEISKEVTLLLSKANILK